MQRNRNDERKEVENAAAAALQRHQYTEALRLAEILQQQGAMVQALQLKACIGIESGDCQRASAAVETLRQLCPQDAYTGFLSARVRFQEGERESLLPVLEQVLRKGKNLQPVYREKICNLLGQCYRAAGDAGKAAGCYLEAFRSTKNRQLQAEEYSNYLFNLNYRPGLSTAKLYAAHKGYEKIFAGLPKFLHRRRTDSTAIRKLRIGYISPDFRKHVVLCFSYAFLAAYQKEGFEVFVYMTGSEDEVSQSVASFVTGWRNLQGFSAEQAARCIYEDQIDILVDLSGHTRENCLPVLAYKPAPVQVSGIGYFATTGLSAVDYFLGDAYLDDRTTEAAFTEKLLVLPNSHFCYTPLGDAPEPAPPPCQKNSFVTFGSFNNFTKLNDEVLKLWAGLLQRLPDAHLLLKADIFQRQTGREQVTLRLRKLGFDMARVELRGFTVNYLSEYADVDIALDPWPYPGGGTTCDALYMGVPVISMRGQRHGARFGYSLLMNLGLGELCAADADSYCRIAVQLAEDTELLSMLHTKLRPMMEQSPLMDQAGYMQSVERAYHAIWREFCARQPIPAYRELPRLILQMRQLGAAGDTRQALAAADAVLAAGTTDTTALELMTALYIDAADCDAARQSLVRLQQEKGSYAYGLFLQARIEHMTDDWGAALQHCRAALQGRMEDWQRGLAYNILSMLEKDCGDTELAAEHSLEASRCSTDRAGRAANYSNYLFALHYSKYSREAMYQAACGYQRIFDDIQPYGHVCRNRHERLRIGYISPDLRYHVVAFFSYVFFKNYDRNCFAVYCYANCQEDAASQEFASGVDQWRNIQGLQPDIAAKLIYEDEIDILVDLAGHTEHNCLPVLAYKPAPVQVSGIGYFNTTGLKAVDYFLADIYTDPVGEGSNDAYFTEKLLRLPQSHFCYTWHGKPGECAPAPCGKNGFVTFGSFNNFAKVTEEMLQAWAEILRRLPEARLFLKAEAFNREYTRQKAMQRLQQAGIPLQRVCFGKHEKDYLGAYGQVDIALDTYPYPGGGTTCDALYMGVPVITMVGTRHNARFGYSLMMNIGLSECCAFSLAEYIEKAVGLAQDAAKLQILHQTLRRRMRQSPVMDVGSYMAAVEKNWQQIWQDWVLEAWTPEQRAEQQKKWAASAVEALAQRDWPIVIRQVNRLAASGRAIPGKLLSAVGLAYSYQGDDLRAIIWLKRAIRSDAENKVQLASLLSEACSRCLDIPGAQEASQMAFEALSAGNKGLAAGVLMRKARCALLLGNTGQAAADYRNAAVRADNLRDRCESYSSYLLSLAYREIASADLLLEHQKYAEIFAQIKFYPVEKNRKRQKKLHIGYLSPDFRQHVMFSFYYALLACYDHEVFQVTCYSLTDVEDGYTEALRELVDDWQSLSLQENSYESIAAKIHADRIDILVDLAGHSAGSGLPILAWRPALVQMSGLGYMATTGLSTVDYFLTDCWLDPVQQESQLIERPLRLHSQFCYTGRSDVAVPAGAPCKHTGKIVFGVFNQYAKITDEMLLVWKEIMMEVPVAELLLKTAVFQSDAAIDQAFARLQGLGLDMDRVHFEAADVQYMERYLDVDIALDTYPYPGGGTTADALYMGVPVVSLYGKRRGTRVGLSILQAAGLGELAVPDRAAYIACAVGLASDVATLDLLHTNLRSMLRQSSLMDAKGYVREMEQKYQEIWETYEGRR